LLFIHRKCRPGGRQCIDRAETPVTDEPITKQEKNSISNGDAGDKWHGRISICGIWAAFVNGGPLP